MIDINKMRKAINRHGASIICDDELIGLLDRLEAAERERDECNARRLEAADHFSAQVREISSALEETRRERDVEEQRACDLHVECCNLITEIDALRAKIERMERQEPVVWQVRSRPTWNDGPWSEWRKCSEGSAQDIKNTPLLHDWHYEVRALYALPGAKGE